MLLGQRLDGKGRAVYNIHHQAGAVEKTHAEERAAVGGKDLQGAFLPVPDDNGPVDAQ